MFFKYLFHNKRHKLDANLCERCFQRLFADKSHSKARRSSDSLRFQRIAKQYLYFKDKDIVELVANHLSDDLPNDNSVIFESSPGTALLTKHLLKSGAQKVRVFEDNPIFLDKLKVSLHLIDAMIDDIC